MSVIDAASCQREHTMLVISTESSSLPNDATHCVNVHSGDLEIITRQAVIILSSYTESLIIYNSVYMY